MIEKLKGNLGKFFSKNTKIKISMIVLILLVVVGIIITFSMRKTINLIVDGENKQIVTYKETVQGALHDNGIVVAPEDKVEPALDSKISNNDTIKVKRAVDISVNVDGEKLAFKSSEDTVQALLEKEEIKLDDDDKVIPSKEEELKEGLEITIVRATNVLLKVDGKELKLKSAENNVEDLLNKEDIKLDDDDKVIPSKDAKIEEGLEIEVIRVETKEETVVESVDFQTNVKEDSSLLNNVTKVIKDGANGEKQVVYKVVFENGKEASREAIKEIVIKEPVNKEVVKGTQKTINRGSISASKVINVKATAYCPTGSGPAYTASGMQAIRNAAGYSTIAVDPSIIPLGTKVYVEGYGYAIAADTGSAIRGNIIDVFFNTFNEAAAWGVKYLKVYVL